MKTATSQLKARARQVYELLEQRYPEPEGLLEHQNAWELLVATVLAAQCTDARVNLVTPEFFRRWPDPAALAGANQDAVEQVIHSTGFFRNKAKNLIAAARYLLAKHAGQVPQTLAELVKVPGVARKTGNVVLYGAYGINQGLAVDTHVKRITYRLGLTEHTDPVRIERDLLALFPQAGWGKVNHRLVWFGRQVCTARRPNCAECELSFLCPAIGLEQTKD